MTLSLTIKLHRRDLRLKFCLLLITWRHYLYCFLCHIGKLMISSDWKLSQDYTATVPSCLAHSDQHVRLREFEFENICKFFDTYTLFSCKRKYWTPFKQLWIFLCFRAHQHYSRCFAWSVKEVDFFECQSCVSYWKISERLSDFYKLLNGKYFSGIQSFFLFFWWIDFKHFVTTNLQIISRRRDRQLTLTDPFRKS